MTNPEPGKRWARAGVRVACVAAAVLGGCQPKVSTHGRERDVRATYGLRTLTAELGPEVQVLTVQAAAEQALRRRGYIITRTTGTADRARVEAKSAGDGSFDKVVVESWVAPGATGVSVVREPWGDEEISRSILDGILNGLGR